VLLARADSSAGPLAGIVATEVGPSSVEEVRLPIGAPGAVSGRVVFTETPLNPPGPVRLVHTLLDVSALYPSEESMLAPDGAFLDSASAGHLHPAGVTHLTGGLAAW
jgi:hypothetical protein